MLTLNKLKEQLIQFFTAHKQINDVKYCDDFDFAADRNLNFPVCNIEYMNSNIANRSINHIFKIVLGDLMNDNVEGIEDEIYSDMLLVAEDFFAWLGNHNDFSFNKTSSINKFVDDKGDRVAGIVFTVTLAVIRTQNICLIPTDND